MDKIFQEWQLVVTFDLHCELDVRKDRIQNAMEISDHFSFDDDKADEGRYTVVLDKTDYIQKANNLLEDRQAYLRCDGEPMKKLMTQLAKTLAEMQTNEVKSKSVRLAGKPTDASAPRFYGIPKLHKADIPLRSIVSLRGTPTFNLAKCLCRHLRSLTSGTATTVTSATQFLERLRGMRLNTDEVMVSFETAKRTLGDAIRT
ncbi:unnamed protein product [Schistocephalus solidus]|uniref:Uncharacterized protein n=1 Tax=Schistocephalus solidus TaxID=70667 RepID=A0A183TTL6_SCHSO|nr:unnamed protein product [Schistocephalus solidus]